MAQAEAITAPRVTHEGHTATTNTYTIWGSVLTSLTILAWLAFYLTASGSEASFWSLSIALSPVGAYLRYFLSFTNGKGASLFFFLLFSSLCFTLLYFTHSPSICLLFVDFGSSLSVKYWQQDLLKVSFPGAQREYNQ